MGFNHRYKIIKKDDDQLILGFNGNVYYLNRLLKLENLDTYFSNDTVRYPYYTSARYRYNLFSYFCKKIPKEFFKDTSMLIDVEFILRKNGKIDSINLKTDSSLSRKLTEIIENSSKKWNVSEIKDQKIDSKIYFTIFVKSAALNNIGSNKIENLFIKMVDQGDQAYKSGNYDLALKYYTEDEKLFDSYMSQFWYSLSVSLTEYKAILENGTNSIMNIAAIYYRLNQYDKACEEWRKISVFDKEAISNYNKYCFY